MNGEIPGEWAARDVFLSALDLPAERRIAYVSEQCRGDKALERAVLGLLGSLSDAGSYLSLPQVQTGPVVGDRIGPYRLLERIGEGGFGLVYMAEQEQPIRRRVAVKVLRPGMGSGQVIARFEAERQALALMDHPNIAKVLDAGTTESGSPYFVMELVRGEPITIYCDQNRLSPRERLELMAPVCRAVQHAHTKGVIHRDLKPGNVLVTSHDGKPVPKVIDFGIAKAVREPLTDRTLFTEFRAFVGTPAYMSPEQAELSGLDIDTRSDVYSLGVLLYELLTGSTPFDADRLVRAGLAEIQRIIREEEPARPSTRLSTMGDKLSAIADRRRTEPGKLGRLMRGDVDWIVMRAMEKERTRRYETAESLAADLERYLNGMPVLAGPPGAGYRFRRFVGRNRGAVAAGTLILAALTSGFGLSLWGFLNAARARDRAIHAEDQQRRLAAESDRARALAEARAARSRAAAEVAQVAAEFIDWGLGFAAPGFAVESGVRNRTMPELVDLCAERVATNYSGKPRFEAAAHYHLGRMYTALGRVEDAGNQLRLAMDLWDKHGPPDEITFVTACSELAFAEYQLCVGPRTANLLRERKFVAVIANLESESSRFAAPLAAWGKAALAIPRGSDQEIFRARDAVLTAWKQSPPARNSEELLLVVDAMCTPVCKVAVEARSDAVRAAGLAFAKEIDAYCPEQFTRNIECLFMALGLVGVMTEREQQADRLALCDRLLSASLGAVARDHWVRSFAEFIRARAATSLGRFAEGQAAMVRACQAMLDARGPADGYTGDVINMFLFYVIVTRRFDLLSTIDVGSDLPVSADINALIRTIGTQEFIPAAQRLTAAIRALPESAGPERRRILKAIIITFEFTWNRWFLDEKTGIGLMEALLAQDPGPDPAVRLAYARLQILRGDAAAYAKDFRVAERVLREAIATQSELLGESYWQVHSTRGRLGGSYVIEGRYEEAESELQASFEWLAANVGTDFGETLGCFRRLCQVWAKTGRPERIADVMERWAVDCQADSHAERAAEATRFAAWQIVRRPALPAAVYRRAESVEEALIARYKSPDDRICRNMALWRTGRSAEAMEDQRLLREAQASKTSGRDPLPALIHAAMLRELGDHAGAKVALAEALQIAELPGGGGGQHHGWDELCNEVKAAIEAPVR